MYGSNLSTVNRGDSVNSVGVLTSYNNLLEVTPVTTIGVQSTGHALPTPAVITPSQLGETYEGELVRINNCTFALGGGTFTANTSYTFTSATQTGTVFISNTNALVAGTTIPTTPVNLVGILSQHCTAPTSGCTTGYQLVLRDLNDIINNASIYLTTQPYPTNIATTSIDINWITNIAGSGASYIKYGKTSALELGTIAGTNSSVNHVASITGATAATIYYARVYSINGTDTASCLTKVFCTKSNSSGSIKAYFDRTVNTAVSTGTNAVYLNNGIVDTIVAYINRAQSTLDIAIYNWDTSNGNMITSAVNAAANRGVKVRIIYDGSTSQAGIAALVAGVKKVASPQGTGYTIMHNKFMIIDANSSNPNIPVVWTGSTNWTSSQLSTDANNAIVFQDQSLARGYRIEFNEMWGDTSQTSNANVALVKFGQFKTDNTPHEYLIGGKRVESYFSPSDGTTSHIIATIGTANTDFYFGTDLITRSDIANKIASQTTAIGVGNSKGILDDTVAASSQWFIMHNVMGSNIIKSQFSWIFHHKYLIVDQSNTSSDPLVLTGSHNWSTAGETKNDENTVIVHDASIANQYYQEFSQRWNDETATGINSYNYENASAVIYPNPNNGNFMLSYTAVRNETVNIKLYDMIGHLVYSRELKVNNGFNPIEINTPSLNKGIYLFEVVTDNGKQTNKLVIQ
jgi:phosphatidylserine/phosphatidylglycerophosphate/cardiolipin synthase-like enzyme